MSKPDNTSTDLSRAIDKLGIKQIQRHIFLCCDQTKPKCCAKEDSLESWNFLKTRLKQLKPARFNFIADADTTVDGFLAHEAQAVVPESVVGTHNEVDDDGAAVMQGIDQSKLVPLLVKTIQELEARITALEGA